MGKNKIGIIVGSTRPQRISFDIAQWVNQRLKGKRFVTEIIDLADIDLPLFDEPEIPASGHYQHEHTKKWSKLIQQFDGFVFVYPQYNWGYPAVLKNALDFLFQEWNYKPVSLIPHGSHGGFQAQIGLQLVIQGLKMKPMAVNPALTITHEMFNEKGKFIDIQSAFEDKEPAIQLLGKKFDSLFYKNAEVEQK